MERVGAKAVPLRANWGKSFPEEMLEEELDKHTNGKMVLSSCARSQRSNTSFVGVWRIMGEYVHVSQGIKGDHLLHTTSTITHSTSTTNHTTSSITHNT